MCGYGGEGCCGELRQYPEVGWDEESDSEALGSRMEVDL